MILTPTDISKFIYCPYLLSANKTNDRFNSSLSLFEKCVIMAFKATELHCLINGTELYPKKIITQWDKIWWPLATKNGINISEIEKLSIRAASIFADYCKYDVSIFATVGVDIESQLKIGNSILKTTADIIKVDTDLPYKNIYVIGFGNKPKTIREIILDPAIRTNLYAIYDYKPEEEKVITYIYIRVQENQNKLLVTSSILRQDNIEEIRQMLNFVERGIRNKVKYMNLYNCEECKKCRDLEL